MKRIIFLLLLPIVVSAQVERKSELFQILKSQDSILFNVGFNQQDTMPFVSLLSNDFEFYHDEAGPTTSKAAFIESIKSLSHLNYKPRRQVIPSSLEVFPLKKNGVVYGAIQMGTHQFYAIEPGKLERWTSTAKFTHLWILEEHIWRLRRVLSYDHVEPSETDIDESQLFKSKAETEKWLVKNRIPALGIGVIKNGKIEETTIYGALQKGIPAPKNAIFNVASLTKPITALIALTLVNNGEWSLDEPIYSYWTDPDVASDPRSKKLTTRHILSHRTGFRNWRREDSNGVLAFHFEPGAQYQYSGEGFEYLRKALEYKFHTSIQVLAERLLFKPIGMNDTHYTWDSTVDEKRFARGHTGSGTVHELEKNTVANGADDLLTTVDDYTKFMLFIINGAGLKPELYKEMISEQVRLKPRKYWGLSWWVDEHVNGNENAIIHGGDDTGVHTIVFMLPESKQGLLIFTNSDNGTDIYIPVIQHYLGKIGQEIIDAETK